MVVNKSGKKYLVCSLILSILSVILIIAGLILAFYNSDNKKHELDKDVVDDYDNLGENNNVENEVIRNGKKLTVYSYSYSVDGKDYIASNISIPEYSQNKDEYKTYMITCKTEECDFYNDAIDSATKDKYVLVDEDNKIVLYDYMSDEVLTEFEKGSIKSIGFGISNDGLVIENINGKYGVYNCSENKNTIPYIYDNIEMYAYGGFQDTRGYYYDVLFDNSVVVKKGNKYGIVDFKTGDIVLGINYDEVLCYDDDIDDFSKAYCKAKVGDKYKIFEYNYKNQSVKNLYYEVDDLYATCTYYAYILDDNMLKLIDLTSLQTVVVYNEFSPTYEYYYDFYNDETRDFMIFFRNTTDTIGEYSYNCVEYYYNLDTFKSGGSEQLCGGIGKPVLYLYPEEETKVIVDFENENLLTTTYPKFIDKWEVLAKPNGDLYDNNDKYYYGLYWEEVLVKRATFEEGFYVEKDDAISFLEEKLSYIGLSDRERNEFIMYWLPILEKNGKNLVYFELTDEREKTNKIYINPQPDSLLRVVIHVKKVDEKTYIKEQKLNKFIRKGFVAVEWGGHNYQ